MCTTCGCQEGNLYIEGDEHNPHSAFRSAPLLRCPSDNENHRRQDRQFQPDGGGKW
jgi:hypothetical protein